MAEQDDRQTIVALGAELAAARAPLSEAEYALSDEHAFHSLWTWAVGLPGYVKAKWTDVYNRIAKLQREFAAERAARVAAERERNEYKRDLEIDEGHIARMKIELQDLTQARATSEALVVAHEGRIAALRDALELALTSEDPTEWESQAHEALALSPAALSERAARERAALDAGLARVRAWSAWRTWVNARKGAGTAYQVLYDELLRTSEAAEDAMLDLAALTAPATPDTGGQG